MRFIQTIALTGLTLLFAASSANAWQVRMESTSAGGNIAVGDRVTVTVDLNTDGGTDLFALGVGVLFDSTAFTYLQAESSSTTYLLYTTAKNPYLVPASTCGSTSGAGCDTYLTNPAQVQLDFISNAVASAAGVPAASNGFENLVTLVFEAAQDGTGGFEFSFNPETGGILALSDASEPPLTLGQGFAVTVPEPGLALMSMAALGTVVLIRRNRR